MSKLTIQTKTVELDAAALVVIIANAAVMNRNIQPRGLAYEWRGEAVGANGIQYGASLVQRVVDGRMVDAVLLTKYYDLHEGGERQDQFVIAVDALHRMVLELPMIVEASEDGQAELPIAAMTTTGGSEEAQSEASEESEEETAGEVGEAGEATGDELGDAVKEEVGASSGV